MSMKVVVTLVFLYNVHLLFAQNLIPNGSFEEVNICKKYHEECAPKGWRSSTLKNFYYPEYLPNTKMAAVPKEGSRTIALTFYFEGKEYERKFAQATLVCELKKGEQYRFKIHYLLKKAAVNSFGIYFAEELKVFKKNDYFKTVKPQIEIPIRRDLAENEWAFFEIEYTAKGGEKGIVIGNFKENVATEVFPSKGSSKREFKEEKEKRIYVRLDAISLIPLNEAAHSDCPLEENLQTIYEDSVRHVLEHPKVIHPLELEIANATTERVFEYEEPEQVIVIGEDTVQTNQIFSFANINFATNQAILLLSSYPVLEEIAAALNENPALNLRIVGHTDNIGRGNFNQMLSELRAKAVADYLVRSGVSRRRLTTFGMGESTPIKDNESKNGRAENRRVEFLLVQ